MRRRPPRATLDRSSAASDVYKRQIHSFKGWELKRVLIYFRLHELQYKERIQLLYTAITRAQDSVAVFNAEPTLFAFGQLAAQEGLVAWREPPAGPAAGGIGLNPAPLHLWTRRTGH